MMADVKLKPFLKWAGGKSQLLGAIDDHLPYEIKNSKKIIKYCEPFLGGGAVFFHLISNYDVKEAFISDYNKELILIYKVVQNDVSKLIKLLSSFQDEYLALEDNLRKEYYLQKRKEFNENLPNIDFNNYSNDHIERASYSIFMNKTGFNGLFRLNKKGEFNVPAGKYKNPLICDKNNLRNVSKILKNVIIECGDFTISDNFIDKNSLVYFDPPFRPISQSSYFQGYAGNNFDDSEQIRLSNFYKKLSERGAKLILSNSDPQNVDKKDMFFEDLYKNYVIDRVKAKRSINSIASKRGEVNELLITNF